MDTIEFKNALITEIYEFLAKIPLYNRSSLGRTRLCKLLDKKAGEFKESHSELIKMYAKLDEEGKPISKPIEDETGNYEEIIFKSDEDRIKFLQDFSEFVEQTSVIDITEYKQQMKDLLEGLYNLDYKISGKDSDLYAILCEELEKVD